MFEGTKVGEVNAAELVYPRSVRKTKFRNTALRLRKNSSAHRGGVNGKKVLAVGTCGEDADFLLDAHGLAGGGVASRGGCAGRVVVVVPRGAASEHTAEDSREDDDYSNRDTNIKPLAACLLGARGGEARGLVGVVGHDVAIKPQRVEG